MYKVLVCTHTTLYGKPLSSANNVLIRCRRVLMLLSCQHMSALSTCHLNTFLIRSTQSKAMHEIQIPILYRVRCSISLICFWYYLLAFVIASYSCIPLSILVLLEACTSEALLCTGGPLQYPLLCLLMFCACLSVDVCILRSFFQPVKLVPLVTTS